MYNKIKFGNKISVARRKKGLKQTDVCNKLGIHQTTYSKIENGKGEISLTNLYLLSSLLGVSILWLLEIDEDGFTDEETIQIENFKRYIIGIRENG